jgi:hypothetical protein
VRIHSLIQAFDFIVTGFLLVQQLLDHAEPFSGWSKVSLNMLRSLSKSDLVLL